MSLLASFDWHFIWAHHSDFLAGLRNTLKVAGIAIAGAFAVGVVLGAVRAHRIPVLSQLVAVYVEVIRNTPILVQIFLLYYGLLAPPVIWAFEFNLNYALASHACYPAGETRASFLPGEWGCPGL